MSDKKGDVLRNIFNLSRNCGYLLIIDGSGLIVINTKKIMIYSLIKIINRKSPIKADAFFGDVHLNF